MTTGVSNFSYSSFQAKYKYHVNGVEDPFLRSVSSLIKNDDAAFNALKSARTREMARVKALETSEPDPALRTAAAAKEKLSFLQKATSLLSKTSIEGKMKAKVMAPVLSKTANELKSMVDDYAANTADSPADQASFLSKAQALVDKLQGIILHEKPKLRSEGQFYNASMVNATRQLAAAETAITTQLGGGGSSMVAAGSGDSGTGGSIDITV